MDPEQIARKAERRLRAQRAGPPGTLFGLGMFGLIGWSVAVPALAAIALGLWLDRRWPGPPSWTLMLLVAGVALGCVNAWYWIERMRADDEAGPPERRGDDG